MRKGWSSWVCLLSVCLVLSSAGCFTGQDYAVESGSLLEPGMSMDDVQARLGDPSQVIKGGPGTDTEWIYRYEGGPGTALTIFFVVFFVVLIIAVVLAKSKGGSGGVFFGVGGGNGPPYQIRVHFDSTGRVLGVSPPYAVELP